MADIFISYKREEREKVERLATALRGLGFSVLFDASLSAGEAFTDEIDREVRAAKVVLVCWSPAAAGSDFVKAEALIGFGARRLLSTFVEGPAGWSPPVPFNGQQMEDLRAWVERPSARDPAWKSVLRRLGALTARADVADWGALPAEAELDAIQAWFARHGATSPLVLDAEAAFTEAQARGAARAEAEAAARERLARAAAEENARMEIEAAELRVREAEQKSRLTEARARFTRRALIWGSGSVGMSAVGAGAFVAGFGLEGPYPFLRGVLPSINISQAGRDASVRIRPLARLKGHAERVQSAAFSPDGMQVVTASFDWTARLWDTTTGAEIARFHHRSQVTSAAFSADGERVVTASQDGTVWIWDARTGKGLLRLKGHDSVVNCAAFSLDAAKVVTGSNDNTARIWNTSSGAEIQRFDHVAHVTSAVFDHRGEKVVTASLGRPGRVWDAKTGLEIGRVPLRGGLQQPAAVINRIFDDLPLVTLSSDEVAGDLTRPMYWHEIFWLDPVADLEISTTAAFSADGAKILSVSNRTATIWDVAAGAELAALNGYDDKVASAASSPDGNKVVTISSDDTARIWDSTTGAELARLNCDEPLVGRVDAESFNPNGTQVVTAYVDSVRIWDAASGAELARLRGHGDELTSSGAFSANGKMLVTTSWDKTALVWEFDG